MPEAAPFHADIADGPEGGAAYWTRARDGVRIRVGLWSTGDRGTALILPGRTEYIEKYGPAAAEFAEAGYATAAVDWRGQGLADRLLDNPLIGHVGEFSDHQDDLAAMLRVLDEVAAPRPHHLVAHSMGGAIGLRALIRGLDVASAVFSAPMWDVHLSPYLRSAAWILGYANRMLRRDGGFAPGRGRKETYIEETPFEENLLTNHEPTYRWMRAHLEIHPDLKVAGPSWRWVLEALVECRSLARFPPPDIPCLIILGADETIVESRAIRNRAERWPGAVLLEIPGCRHEPMMEAPAVRNRVFRAAREHFERRARPTNLPAATTTRTGRRKN